MFTSLLRQLLRPCPAGRLVLALGIAFATHGFAQSEAQAKDSSATLVIETANDRHVFKIEPAATPSTRSRGLMYRRELASGTGMLFDFGADQYVSMWMKNTYLPLDMIFIDAAGKITNIAHRTVPHSLVHIPSTGKVRGVFEINSGLASKLNINAGDYVRHPTFKPNNKPQANN